MKNNKIPFWVNADLFKTRDCYYSDSSQIIVSLYLPDGDNYHVKKTYSDSPGDTREIALDSAVRELLNKVFI